MEALVAFIIAGLALVALFRGGVGGLRAASESGRYAEAISRAQSHLAATTGDALVASDRQGDEGRGFHWHVRVSSVAVATTPGAASQRPALTLYAVSAAESWTEDGSTRTVQLDTEAAAAAAPPRP